ncbi:MAG: hypothetical protein ACKVWR_05710 [Acidimicrobiales bacterium]
MEIAKNTFACRWCATVFPRRVLCGRKPHYCGRSCRQRAYEHRRRGRAEHGRPRPTLVEPLRGMRRAPAYEAGVHLGPRHALRVDGIADRRRLRPTLCGALARPVPYPFSPVDHTACRTCRRVAERFPAPRELQVSNDLALVTALFAHFRRERARPRRRPLAALVDELLAASPV